MSCEDQMLTPLSDGCRQSRCITFKDGKPLYPKLVEARNFWRCPKCGGFYGPVGDKLGGK